MPVGILANFAISSLAIFASKGVRLIYVAACIKVLGAQGWGTFATLFLIFGFLYLLVDCGRGSLASLHNVSNNFWHSRFFNSLVKGRLLQGLVLWILAAIVLEWGKWEGFRELQVYLSLLIWRPLLVDWLLQRQQRSGLIHVIQFVRNLLLLLVIVWYGQDLSVWHLIIAELITEILASGFSCLLAKPDSRRSWSWQQEKWMLGKSIPLLGIAMFSLLHLSADGLVIRIMLGTEALGIYDGIYKIVQAYLLLAGAFGLSVRVPLALMHERKEVEPMIVLIDSSTRLLLLVSFLFWLGSLHWGKWLVLFLFPEHVEQGVRLLMVLATYVMLTLSIFPVAEWFLLTFPRKKFMAMVAVAGISNVMLNILVVPIWGLLAAAAVTLVVELGIALYLVRQYYGRHGRFPWKKKSIVWPLLWITVAVVFSLWQGIGWIAFVLTLVFIGGSIWAGNYFSREWRSGFLSK